LETFESDLDERQGVGRSRLLVAIIGRASGRVLAAKILLSLVVVVLAASISVTSSSYQAEFGSNMNIANGLRATDKGFSLSSTGGSSAGTACSSPIVFGILPQTASTTVAAGHLVYDVQVNSTTGMVANTKFNVTLTVGSTPYGPLCIQTPAVPADGQTVDCKFDIGTALPSSPYTFKVTVQ
jgi:hypothetical protein